MLVIALTGGIGSGKTTVSDLFKSKNIPVIDTDIIAREIVEKGKHAYIEIIEKFGKEILDEDKNINRQALGKIIFSSDKKRIQLEDILHPIIWDNVKSQVSLLADSTVNSPPYCIVVVPLLLENLSQNKPVIFDRILVIDTEEEIQIKRSKNRDNSDESAIKNIIKSQVTRQTRIEAADDIILNTGSLDSLKNEVAKLHKQYLELAS